jgi:hypothetical protein
MSEQTKFKYVDTALPTGANTVTLFTTAPTGTAPFATLGAFMGANGFDSMHIARIHVGIVNDQTGTLKAYQSLDRGVTWTRVVADTAVAVVAANSENEYDYLVEGFADWRLDWTNGGSNQTTFKVRIAGTSQRVIGN